MAILSLVASDNQALRNLGSTLFYALNLIAIPLLFFCIGMLVQVEQKRRSLFSLVMGVAKLYVLGIALYAPKQIEVTSLASLQASVHAVVWGTGNSLYNVPLWLLAALVPGLCLFSVISTSSNSLIKRLSGPLTPLVVTCLTYWFLSLQLVNMHAPRDLWGRPLGLPWSVDLAPLVASMLLLGAWYQTQTQEIHRYVRNRTTALCLMSVVGLLVLSMLPADPALDLNYRMIQSWPCALSVTLLGMAMIVSTAHLLCIYACKARHLFALLGRNGLIILLVFWPVQNAFVDALPESVQRSSTTALAASVTLAILLAGLSQSLINRHSFLKRIAYV